MPSYDLPGARVYQERLFNDPELLDPQTRKDLGLDTYADVIAHFTRISLQQDGIGIVDGSLKIGERPGGMGYSIAFEPVAGQEVAAAQFAAMHEEFLSPGVGGLMLDGFDACRKTQAFNPMAGFPVNPSDGPSEWLPILPLGMPMANQKAVMLTHYPPIVSYRNADYLNNMSLHRWSRVLQCIGMPDPDLYHTFVDVNPIAAPGSGESEYPNEYFSMNLTSLFYDDEARGLTYVRSMLELLLDPPANASNPLTLPLMVCGSPLYDPQGPAWFRTRYKEHLPVDKDGVPTVTVLQTGLIQLSPGSAKMTPYMIANHPIAAGVTGKCTSDPATIPDIRKYEAQDLVAATWLSLAAAAAAKGQAVDPAAALAEACQRWFGADNPDGAPNPASADDKLVICALAQMDINFNYKAIAPLYTYDQAVERCKQYGGGDLSPCWSGDPPNSNG